MQGGALDSSKTGNDEFEEMMRSAFWKGIELLSVPESGTAQSQEQTEENPGKSASEHMEGMSGVPNNVAQLKPIIDKLIRKDLPKGADKQWRMQVKEYVQWVHKIVLQDKEHLKELLSQLAAVI